MIITGDTCYSRLLWLMCSGELLELAVSKIEFDSPKFSHEGMAGYIETKYKIVVRDLVVFTRLWESWNSLTHKRKMELYGLAKGLGDCK